MAITTAVCNSYKQEAMQGVHQPADDYKLALYASSATLDATTTAYTATGEVTGTGYTAGGKSLTGFTSGLASGTAYIDFDDPVWSAATITARGAIIYNATRSNAAVVVLDFGSDIISTAGDFTVTLPAPGASAVATIA